MILKEVRNNCEWKCWGIFIFLYIKNIFLYVWIVICFIWFYMVGVSLYIEWIRVLILRRFKFKWFVFIVLFLENFIFILLISLYLKENDVILSEYVW